MTTRRPLKAAEAIREVVSMAILTDLNDPRISDVTVTYVEVSPDLRQAKVHVSVMGDDTKSRLCLAGLRSAAGYLQSKLGNRINARYTPRLEFVLDMGVKKSIAISEILGRVLPRAVSTEPEEDDETDHIGSIDEESLADANDAAESESASHDGLSRGKLEAGES